jgi:hypothetical protein
MSKRSLLLLLVVLLIVTLLYGCAGVRSPVTNGFLVTAVQGPVGITQADTYSKTGTSSCVAVLGIVSAGNASIEAAIKDGGITKIHHVDHKSFSLLGLFAKFTTIVYGD